jgi:hypothetical protein
MLSALGTPPFSFFEKRLDKPNILLYNERVRVFLDGIP